MGIYGIDSDLDPKKDHVLYKDDDHEVIYLGTNMSNSGDVDVNSYIIINRRKGFLLDPVDIKYFPKFFQISPNM